MFKINNSYTTDFTKHLEAILESTPLPSDLISHIIKPMIRDLPEYEDLEDGSDFISALNLLLFKDADLDEAKLLIEYKLNTAQYLFLKYTLYGCEESRLNKELRKINYHITSSILDGVIVITKNKTKRIDKAKMFACQIIQKWEDKQPPEYHQRKEEEYEEYLESGQAHEDYMEEIRNAQY